MSQTVILGGVSKIPLGQRIGELMEEKGGAFSIRAFSQRVGLSKDMLGRMISGDRHISPSELERLANGLSVPVQRIKQEDTKKDREELLMLIKNNTNAPRAVLLAKKILPLATGISEKCQVFDELGSALYLCRKYEEAHSAWLEAYAYAKKIHERYEDKETFLNVLAHLILSYTQMKEYSYLSEILKNVEPILASHPSRAAVIYYSLAKISEKMGDLEGAREKYYQSLFFYKLTNHQTNIGIAKHNTAAFEYRSTNYMKAKNMFEDALTHLEHYEYGKLLCHKEYAKTLIKIDEISLAEPIIVEAIERINSNAEPYAELRAQYTLLLARIREEPVYAEAVINSKVRDEIRQIAAKFLINYYDERDDSQRVMKYYRVIKHI